MAETNSTKLVPSFTVAIAILALFGSVAQVVWQSSRNDVAALEGRLERATVQLERQLAILRDNDNTKLSLNEHAEFKRQIEKVIDRNTATIDTLLVKIPVFDQYRADQANRDALAKTYLEDQLKAVDGRVSLARDTIDQRMKALEEQVKAIITELAVRRTQFVTQEEYKAAKEAADGRVRMLRQHQDEIEKYLRDRKP